MQFNFFADDRDVLQVWRWLAEWPGMEIIEEWSRPGLPPRWFRSWPEAEATMAGDFGNLTAWPSAAGGKPVEEAILFTPETQAKLAACGRTVLRSPALFTISHFGDQRGCLAAHSFGYWSEKSARRNSAYSDEELDQIDWRLIASIAGKVKRQIGKASPAKLYAAPIMKEAFAGLKAGRLKLWGWGEAVDANSPLIKLL